MNAKQCLINILTENRIEKLTKCLAAAFIIVLSVFVLAVKIPNSKLITDTTASIKDSQSTVMEFSGATIATSLAISALPDDFASPLAGTLADLNTYFIFVFAVLFVEELVVVEGVKIAFAYIIPAACALYILYVIFDKLSEAFKTAIQGISDLLAYFENVIRRCVNSIAIMIVTSFVLPILVLFLFRWLLNELFAWNLPKPQINIPLPKVKKEEETLLEIEDKGVDA